jgi:Flp pilus assembly protein TadD
MPPKALAPPRSPRRFAPWLLVAAIGLAYLNSLRLPFIFDDVAVTIGNPTIRHLATAWDPPPAGSNTANRPVTNFTFALNHAISGDAPWSYHATNVLIHVLAALTLAGLIRRTLLLPGCAGRWNESTAGLLGASAALLWAVHPLQTATVTAIAQRTESLCGLFYLLVFYNFVRGLGSARPWRWWIPALVSSLLGMGTKEVMVTAPLLLGWFDRTFVAGSLAGAWRQRGRLHVLMIATWLPLGWILWQAGGARGPAAGFGLGVEWWQYALKQCEAIVHYLRLACVPWPLVYDYGTGVTQHLSAVWWQAALLMLLVGATLWAAWRRPAVGFPALWFFVILAPSSSVVPLVMQTMAEHRMYLPLAGLVGPAVLLLYRGLGARLPAVVAILALAGIAATAVRNRDYRSELEIWGDTVAKVPDNRRAHSNLGYALLDAGDTTGAVAVFEQARMLAPDDTGGLINLANALIEAGRPGEARTHLQHAIALQPEVAPVHLNLGHAWLAEQRVPEARDAYATAARLDPRLAEAPAHLGGVQLQLGEWEGARRASIAALALDPALTGARRNLGVALLQLHRPAEAAAELARVHAAEPADQVTIRALAFAHAQWGQPAEAMRWAQRGLQQNPSDPALRQLVQQLAPGRP